MAASNQLETQLAIKVQTDGEGKLVDLARDVEQLGEGAGVASPEFGELGRALRELGQQKGLIDEFSALKRETVAYGEGVEAAQAATQAAARALREKKADLEAAAAAERNAAVALDASRTKHDELKLAVAGAANELKGLRARAKESGDATGSYATEIEAAKTRLAQLREASAAAATSTKALAADYKPVAAALKDASGAAAAAEKNFARNREEAGRAKTAFEGSRLALHQTRQALQQAGIASGDLAGAQQRLSASADQVAQRIENLRTRLATVAPTATAAADATNAGFSKAAQGVRSISEQLARVRTELLSFFGIQVGAQMLADLGRTADLYANLGARLALVNSGQAGFNVSLAQTAQLARDTHTGLESTTNLLSALARAGESVGISQGSVLRLTETINKANQVSGASAASADAALTQLIQGLQSGALRGDEFNSVMEQSPRLAKALADGLGVPIGALRQMAEDGKLTSAVVVRALQSQAQVIDAEFGKLPLTIGRAMTDLSTNWTQFLGELDQGVGASESVAKALAGVGNNLDTIASLATVAGEAALAAFAAKAAPAVLAFGSQVVGSITSMRAAHAANSAALADATTRHGTYSRAVQVAARELAALKTAHVASGAAAAAHAESIEVARARLKLLETRASGAAVEMADFGKKTKESAVSARGLFAAIPGPLKLALSVVGFELLPEIGRWLGETVAKWGEAGEIMKRVSEQTRQKNAELLASGQDLAYANEQYRNTVVLTAAEVARLSDAERAAYLERLNGARDYHQGASRAALAAKELGVVSEFSAEQAAAGLKKAREGLASFDAGARMSRAEVESLLSVDASLLINQFDQLAAKGKDSGEALKGITEGFDANALASVRGFGQALIELQNTGKISADQVGVAWGNALAKLDGAQISRFVVTAQAAFGQSSRDVAALASAIDGALRASIAATGQDFAQLSSGISSGAASALGHLDTLIAGVGTLKAQSVDTAAALAGAINFAVSAADSEAAVEALRAKVQQLGTEGRLSGEQTAAALEKIRTKADEITPGINSAAEAFKELGIVTDAALKETANNARAAFEKIESSGTASARELQQAFRAYAERAIAANGGVASDALKVEAAMHKVSIEADNTGKTVVRAMGEGKAATDQLGDAAEEVASKFDEVGQAAEEAADSAQTAANAAASAASGTSGSGSRSASLGDSFTEAMRRGLISDPLAGDDFRKAFSALWDQKILSPSNKMNLNINALYSQTLEEAAKAVQREASRAASPGAESRATSAPAPVAAVYRVVVERPDGRTTRIDTASAGDAQALAGLLKEFESAASRAS